MTAAANSSDTQASVAEPPSKLKRKITGPLLFLFILGDVLGAGIYALMGVLSTRSAARCGLRCWWRCCWRCSPRAPTPNSSPSIRRRAARRCSPSAPSGDRCVSFLVGFCMLAAGVTSAAGLALAFAGDYLGTFIDVPAVPAAMVFLRWSRPSMPAGSASRSRATS